MDARGRASDPRVLALALTAGIVAVHLGGTLPDPAWLAVLALPAVVPWPFPALAPRSGHARASQFGLGLAARWVRGLAPWLRAPWGAAVAGMLLTVLQAQQRLDERWPASRHGAELEVRGVVASLVERIDEGDEAGPTLRFEFRPDDPALPSRMRVSWYRAAAARVRGGDCWTFSLRVRTPHGSLDPGASDYEGWLYRRGIGALATVRDATPCGPHAGYTVLRTRQAVVDRLASWIGDAPGLAMADALAVGDTSGFSDADWDVFRQTGTSHLVAISGFNIAIAAGAALFLFRWAWAGVPWLAIRWPARKAGLAAAAIVGLGYGWIAGWESPAQRAALMIVALLLAALADRRGEPTRLLALVWAGMLALDPSEALSPGLWLSFGAVCAIWWCSFARVRRPPAVRDAVVLQLVLSVVLAPASLLFFGGVAWPGPFVNLLAVPAMAILTPALVGAAAIGAAWPFAGVPLVRLVADALGLFQQGLAAVAAAVPSAWVAASPPVAAVAIGLLGSVLLFAPRGVPLRALGIVCMVPLFVPRTAPVAGDFALTVLDVGQGLSAIVETSHHVLLFDAGPAFGEGFDAGESIVAPVLLSRGHRRVDRLLLSHADLDHAGGVPGVRRRVRVASELGTRGHPPCGDGQAWTWDGVRFEMLHPGGEEISDNDGSCVLRVSSPRFSALLPGDIERGAEERLLRVHPDRLKSDVLVAPHHGSRTSSSPEFVGAVAPEIAVFAAGWRNRFGHPRPEVVGRYRDEGARLLSTGTEGAVRIERAPDGAWRVESWRRAHARFWNAAPEP